MGKTKGFAGNMLLAFLTLVIPLGGVLVGLLIILQALGINISPINAWLLEHGTRSALILVLTLAALLAAEQLIPSLVRSALSRRAAELEEEARKRAETLTRTLVTTIQVAAVLTAAFMIIAEVGVNIGPLLAGLGIAGIAIGLGAQSLVRDLVGGFFIIIENQYRIGDVVKLGNVAGLVEDISLRRTLLRDLDGVVHSVPNGDVRVASNFTREHSRVNFNVAVAYGPDIDHVVAVINQVGQGLAQDPVWASLILTPPKALGLDRFGDSAFEIKILGETEPIRQWEVMRELYRRLKKAFDQEGIELRASQQEPIHQLALPPAVKSRGGRSA